MMLNVSLIGGSWCRMSVAFVLSVMLIIVLLLFVNISVSVMVMLVSENVCELWLKCSLIG